ncbi:MAG: ATP synthase F1 subunit delta [Thermoanaerobaculia bacterium]|nr:ATP synthase F1 subunit delta [Thermoanaerobaculia bacterium]
MIRSYAKPYAKAILEVTESIDQARSVHAELETFESVRRDSEQLQDSMENPAVGVDDRVAIAGTIAGTLELGALATRILEVLIRNHRINQLGAILDALEQMIHEEAGISVAKVRVAHELDESQREELRRALEQRFGGKVELEVTTDADLLGGFVAQLGSEIYDASVRGRIENLRETLV